MGSSATTKTLPVAVIRKGEATEIRLTLEDQRGQPVLDCRAFDRFTATGLYTPTARGFAVPVALLGELAEGFAEAVLAARAAGLLGGGG